jgi:hypothetical protein
MTLGCQTSCYATPINAVVRNIDACDATITNLSCKTFNLFGEPVSTALANFGQSTTGNTVLLGTVTAGNFAGNLTGGTITATGASSLKNTTVTSLTNQGALTQTGEATFNNDVFVDGTLGAAAADVLSGSMTTGGATFTTPTGFAPNYGSYVIRWFNLSCSGNFTPYIQFAKTATATYATGYRVTSDLAGYQAVTSTNRITLSPNTTGLQNGELLTGEITIRQVTATQWFIEGWSQSNQLNLTRIAGNFTDPGTGVDKFVFGVTGGALNGAPTYQIVPIPL